MHFIGKMQVKMVPLLEKFKKHYPTLCDALGKCFLNEGFFFPDPSYLFISYCLPALTLPNIFVSWGGIFVVFRACG